MLDTLLHRGFPGPDPFLESCDGEGETVFGGM